MTDGLRFQSGLGTNFTRRYKEGQQINTLLLAQVINVNYKYNTVDLMSLQHKEVFQNSYANEGKFSAKLPIEFGGRNIAGQPYGQINPIAVGNIVLVGFINADKNMPIVLSVYNDGTVSNKLTQAPFANADPTDEELQRHTYQKFQVYPSLTYDGIDGEGTRVASFSGKSFFLVSASEERDSGTTDAGYGTNYEDLATSYYNDGELIEPMVPMAPTILFNHQGIEDEDGKVDNHKLLFHIERDGTYRTSMLDKTADWRTFFEMKPDGGVRLRRQGDSIRIDDGFEVGEIGISPDGRVYLRNGDTDLEVRADGLYSNGAPLSVDLSSIYEKLEQQDGKLVSMSTSIIKTDEKVQILADKTEYYDDKIVDYDSSFTVMAEMIESKVTATEVQDMIDGAVTDFTGEIAKVQADADRANQVISDMASDNRVTPSEKNQLLTEWDLIQNEYPTYIAQAEVYEVSTANYTAKYNAVKAFVEPILADMTATSVVDGTLMRKTFGAYYTERTALLTAILKDLKDGLVEAMQKASQASIDAGEAKADATQATIDANRANALIADIASDGKLTASEKSQLKKEWDIVLKEYPTTLAQANKYEISTADYTAKYTALQTFVTPLLADMSATSVVDGDQLRAVFANYYDARVKLLRSISDSAKDDLLDYGQRIYVAETKITQTSESITLLATKVQSIEDDVLTNTAELKIQAELISQKVTASEVKNVVDSAINDMTIGTANLYVIHTQTAGLLSETDGTVKTAVDDSVVSDYIKVKASAPYVASVFDNTGSNTIIVAWYDTNKAFISGQAVAGSNDFSQSYKSPSNAVYARVSYKKSKTVKIKFESGTKGSDFSYSWADVKNDQTLLEQYVKDVQEEAQQAQADAENAKNQADNANQAINDMSNDNVLTPLEKQQVLLQWEEIQAEYSKNIDQASKFNVSSTLYASAYSALSTYLTPILADLTSKSIIIGSTMRANFKTYYDRRTTLLNAVAEKAKTLADNAQTVADKADSDLNNIGGYNYVGFSSGDNMLPRLMIDNVGYYEVNACKATFEGDMVALTPTTAGGSTAWYYNIGTSSSTVALNGLSSYRLGDVEVGKWLTATVNLKVTGTGSAEARLYLFNGGSWTTVSSDKVTASQGNKRVTVQAQVQSNTTAVLIRIYTSTPATVSKILFNKVQLEVGIRPTPWKKSDIDIQEDINNVAKELEGSIGNAVSIAEKAQADAVKAQETADSAVTNASKANSAIADIANDNKVTAVEKKSLKKEWDIIVSEKPAILEQATKFGVTSTDYSTKYTALATFITPILADLSTTSVVVGTTLRSTFKAYYDEKTKLLNAVAVKAKELADKAQVDATNAKNTAIQAVADAERAQTTADKSAEDATKANQAINDMSNDNLITPAEKLDIKKEWEVILAEKPINDAQAVKFGVAYADYTAKYNALSTYITPILTSLTTNSVVVGQTMRDTFKAYYTARTTLLNAVAEKAKTLADKAQTDANNAGIKADNAQTSADKAQTSADKAQADANKAQELANNAQATANKAQSDANNAGIKADNAQTDANKANQSISDLSNDNLVTPNEKLDLKKEWEIIVAEKPINDTQADKFGVSKTDYGTKYTALSNYITPILTDLTTNSAIVGQTMRDTFKAYYTARTDLLNSISVKAKELADKAQTDANKAQADADNAQSSADTAQELANNAQTSANKAQSDANTAQSNANKAQTDANKANQSISDLSNDNLVTPSEKLDLKKEWEIIVAEKVINDAQADKFGVSKTDYGTKYTALSNYITPILTSLTTNSVVVGQTMRDTFKAYYTARTTLLNAVAEKAKTLADNAQAVADKADSDLNNIGGYNYVGFSSGDNVLPRLMIDNVGYYTVSNATTAFEGDKVAVTPVTQGATSFWAYDVGSASGTTAKNGLASYRMGDIEVGKWLTATVNLQAFGTGAVMARLHLFNGGAWTYVDSNPVTPADGLKRVTVQAQIKSNTTAVLIRIYPANTPLTITKFTFSKVQLEVGIRPTPWKKSDIDIQEDINNVGESLKDYVKSRGENLITNGFGDLGNNTNIGGIFDGAERIVGKGSFRFDTASLVTFFTEPITLDVNNVYALEYYAKTLNGVGKSYQSILPMDVDGNRISYPTTGGRGYDNDNPVKFTKLTKPLKVGDTEIYVEDVTLWSNTTTATHQRSVILWRYKNSYGFQYPDGVYSQYYKSGTYNVGAVDATAKKITLNSPWNIPFKDTTDGTFPVGHPISPTNDGATYIYAKGHANIAIPNTFTKYTHYLTGSTSYPNATKLPSFTASVQLGFLLNRETTGEKTWLNGLSFKDATGLYTLNTQTAWSNNPDGSNMVRVYPNENTYSKSTEFQSLAGGVLPIREEATAPNGFRFTGVNGEAGGFRIKNVITSNGEWTVSFKMRGSQNTAITCQMDIVDSPPQTFTTTADNSWKEFSMTVNVTNWNSISYNFVDFSNIAWAYFFISDFKVEKSPVKTIYTPSPKDDPVKAEMKYIGYSVKNSDDYRDYTWTVNPKYLEVNTGVELNGKEGAWIYSPTEPSNPAVGVMWVDSSVVPNQPKRWTGAQTGWVALTPEEASDIPWGEDGSSLADWVAQAEQRISADSIINTVLGSEDFTGIFDTKADTEDLTNLASYDDLASMQEEYQRLLQEGIDGIDFSPYVKNSELEQLKDSFNFTIQQAGGVNMLRNSLGFSGLDFWDGAKGENLLLNSGVPVKNSNYNIQQYRMNGLMEEGKVYTIRLKGVLGAGKSHFGVWLDGGLINLGSFANKGNGLYELTFTGQKGVNTATSIIYIYAVYSAPVVESSIEWIKLEEGRTATDWTPAPADGLAYTPLVNTTQNADLSNLGFGSGFLVDHKDRAILRQPVTLPEAKAGLYYAVSFYMNIASTTTGVTAGIKVYEDGVQNYIVGHTDASKVSPNGYQRYYLVYEPSSVNTEIEIFVTGASNTTVVISGIMFNIGNVALKWQPYPSEIYNTNVKIDINGITVKNNQTDGYTMITPQEFSGYARVDGEMERIFTLNGETTEVRMLKAEQRITMLPIAIFAMENSVNRGWAFVSSSAT